MDYSSIKKSLTEAKKDFLRRPVVTVSFVSVAIFLGLAYQAISAYVQNWIVNRHDSVLVQESTLAVATNTGENALDIQLIPQTFEEESETNVAYIEYPFFNIPKFDNVIKNEINKYASEIKYRGSVEGIEKYGVSGHYETPYMGTKIINFRLYLCDYVVIVDGSESRCGHKYKGFNFDLQTQTIVTLDDVLNYTGMDLEELSRETKKKLEKDSGGYLYDDYEKEIVPLPKNFSSFIVSRNEVTFLFEAFKVGPLATVGLPEVSFPRVDIN